MTQQESPPQPSSQQRSQTSQRSQSQRASTSQSQHTQEDDLSDIDRLVAEVIQYFLVMEQKKFPVKKADITKLLQGKGLSAKVFKTVISQAGKYLDNVTFNILNSIWYLKYNLVSGVWLFAS